MIPKIKLRDGVVKGPSKAYSGDAGFDVYNNIGWAIMLGPHEWVKIPLGFQLELPEGWVGIISEKSGMSSSNGIFTIGNIIDCNYRGECHAILMNGSLNTVQIEYQQKVAQLLIQPCYTGNEVEVVDQLSETIRGAQGFGSSGV